MRNALDYGDQILGAMGQFAEQEPNMLFGFLLLGDVGHYGDRPSGSTVCLALDNKGTSRHPPHNTVRANDPIVSFIEVLCVRYLMKLAPEVAVIGM